VRNKIKYQGGITKYLCQKKAARNKKEFKKISGQPNRFPLLNTNKVDMEIISLSGTSTFEDQLLSIYSFTVYAGIPKKWTIYSDKSITEEQKKVFTSNFPFIAILDWDVHDFYLQHKVLVDYLEVTIFTKKINIIVGHPHTGQTIYLDSDIVFYKNIAHYLNNPLLAKGLWYVPDAMWENDVDGYFVKERESLFPINAGFLILNKDFDSADIINYFERLDGKYDYFSEQSAFEYAFRKQGAHMLDPRQFIIDSTDQFDFAIKYYPESIAMRHYTSPVRHKMWQRGWQWHFRAL
jgi:hypothetical protein